LERRAILLAYLAGTLLLSIVSQAFMQLSYAHPDRIFRKLKWSADSIYINTSHDISGGGDMRLTAIVNGQLIPLLDKRQYQQDETVNYNDRIAYFAVPEKGGSVKLATFGEELDSDSPAFTPDQKKAISDALKSLASSAQATTKSKSGSGSSDSETGGADSTTGGTGENSKKESDSSGYTQIFNYVKTAWDLVTGLFKFNNPDDGIGMLRQNFGQYSTPLMVAENGLSDAISMGFLRGYLFTEFKRWFGMDPERLGPGAELIDISRFYKVNPIDKLNFNAITGDYGILGTEWYNGVITPHTTDGNNYAGMHYVSNMAIWPHDWGLRSKFPIKTDMNGHHIIFDAGKFGIGPHDDMSAYDGKDFDSQGDFRLRYNIEEVGGPISNSGFLISSNNGEMGNYEMVTIRNDTGLDFYWRNNDLSTPQWSGPEHILSVAGKIDGVSMIQTNLVGDLRQINPTQKVVIDSKNGMLELVVRVGNKLESYWRLPDGKWDGPQVITAASHQLSGNPALIQSTYGQNGNLELIVPAGDNKGGFFHWYRDNDRTDNQGNIVPQWNGPYRIAENAGKIDAVSLAQSTFNSAGIGDFEVVARIGDKLQHFWLSDKTHQWLNGQEISGGQYTGIPSLMQVVPRDSGQGFFILAAPLKNGGFAYYWRDNDNQVHPWEGPFPVNSSLPKFDSLSLVVQPTPDMDYMIKRVDFPDMFSGLSNLASKFPPQPLKIDLVTRNGSNWETFHSQGDPTRLTWTRDLQTVGNKTEPIDKPVKSCDFCVLSTPIRLPQFNQPINLTGNPPAITHGNLSTGPTINESIQPENRSTSLISNTQNIMTNYGGIRSSTNKY
jgi:hypothetical protein